MRINDLNEKAPKGKKAKRFIRKAKDDFKARYGDSWKQVLYATAWKIFKESEDLSEMDAPIDFAAWFAGSKCVDLSGTPLLMYHGVPGDYAGFDQFSDNPQGHYFTSDPDYAQVYAEKPIHHDPADDTGAIYQVFLSLKNPLVIDENDSAGVSAYSHHIHSAASLKATGHDGMIIRYADGEVEAMVISQNQIVSAVASRPQLKEGMVSKPDIRAMTDAFRDWKSSHAPQCWMDFMPGDAPDEIEIDSLEVEPGFRHQGQGRAAMTEICRLADYHRVTLSLLPVPNDHDAPTMDGDALSAFYNEFGFEWDDTASGATMMMRPPSTHSKRLDESLIAVPPAMLDHVTFLATYHYLWWAKWQLKNKKDDGYIDLVEIRKSFAKLEAQFGTEIPNEKYAVKGNISITKIPVTTDGLPKKYKKLTPNVSSIMFAIVWGHGHKNHGGWIPTKNALVIYPQSMPYMENWPSFKSHPDDLVMSLTTIKGTIEHELRHMMQHVFLGDHPEQIKRKAGYNEHGADYNTSPIEFDPTIGSIATEFVSLWGIMLSSGKPIHEINLSKALSQFVGSVPAPAFHIFSAPEFFKDMKRISPVRYRTAVNKFIKEVRRQLDQT